MSYFARRTLPLIITAICAIALILNFFLDLGPNGAYMEQLLLSFCVVILTAAMGLGIINMVKLNLMNISSRKPGKWIYSIILLASMLIMIVIRTNKEL